MAAKAIDIQTRKRKSKRIRAANKFLANISLDGKIPSQKNRKEVEKIRDNQPPLDKEEIQLISNQSFVQNPSLQTRPKLLGSFSTIDATGENKKADTVGSVASTSTLQTNALLENVCQYNRAISLREPKQTQRQSDIVSDRNLTRSEGQLCGKRVILCSGHHVPFAVYSTLKYVQQDKCSDSFDKTTYKLQRLPDELENCSYGIKGIDIGSKDRPVSYGYLLVRSSPDSQSSRSILSPRRNLGSSSLHTPDENRVITSNTPGSSIHGSKMFSPRDHYHTTGNYVEYKGYDPYLLDDPELRSGRHRKVLRLSSFMVSIIEYVKPSQLKKDLNEQFKEKFPNLEITLSKLRSLKQDLVRLSHECSLDNATVAYSTAYFEMLVLWGKISKNNRKLVIGSCLLLAAKFCSDLKKEGIKQLINHVSDCFRVSTKDLLLFEIQALIAMGFNLHLPIHYVLPHLKRLEFEK